ncbi:PAS domain-containing protein [Halopseudomonas nanhaiensis]|uniref:PAS domain-containing protein n=1 Tax=Halopseudomonas nanhaiensis TaxID=2830842 RepID=UPI001CBBECB0|nr:PAS domain-containing protein [Halopseudomonas nanhaiensis]UAW98448.1 PAS domain-containing protein [Halopseudomonas nanhaiensis]
MAKPFVPLTGRLVMPFGILALAMFFLALALSGWHQREDRWAGQLAAQAELQRLAVLQSQQALKRQALMAAATLSEDEDTLRLVRRTAELAQREGLDSPRVATMRAALERDLSGFWNALQSSGANQLHLHLNPNVVSLLRMHRPESWGDSLAVNRPMLAETQRTGQARSGLEVGRFGLGMSGVVPIRATEADDTPVVATLEVGFGMLPELRQLDNELRAGLAVLLHQPTLAQNRSEHNSDGLAISEDGAWLLDSYSRDEALEWLQTDRLELSSERPSHQLLPAGEQHYLVSQFPMHDRVRGETPAVALILIWRDVTESLAEHQADQLQQMAKWVGAFLAATALLLLLLGMTRAAARRQTLEQTRHQQQALSALNDMAAEPSLELQTRLRNALRLGCEYLGLNVGIVSRIEDDDFLIFAQQSPEGSLQDGDRFDLGQTFCSLVIEQKDVLDLTRIGASEFRHHPCYHTFKAESYIGAPIIVDGQYFGTLSFSSTDPTRADFNDIDVEFMRLCSRWIGSTLTRAQAEQDREALIERFSRLTQHLPGMVYTFQRAVDGRVWFPYASDGIEEVYGITADQAARDGTLAIERIHPDDQQGIVDSIDQSAQSLSVWRGEYRVAHPRLGEIWVAGFASPQRLEEGDIVWYGFIGDVTARKHIELTLERERWRLASIIEGTNIGTGEWNIQTGECVFNERWAQSIGYRLHELEPITIESWRALVHPDDLAILQQRVAHHFNSPEEYFQARYRMRHKDGHWVWMLGRGRVVSHDESGQPLLMAGTHADISDEVRRTEEIRQARASLRAVIDASTEVAIITTDLDGIVTLFNSGAEKLLGYRPDEVIGKTTPERFHLPSEVERRAAALEQELGERLTGMDIFLAKVRAGRPETLPWTFIRKDGTQRLVNLTVTRMADEHNQPTGFLGIATDITELIQATRALQKSESRYRSMVDNLPGAVYRCQNDPDWTMQYLSEEIETITGYPSSDFIDNRVRSYSSIVHPDDLTITYGAQEQINQRGSFELSYRIVHAAGHEVWVREKGRGEFDSQGRLLWLGGFIWDATEQQRIEQMKSQFVSTVSHELRTPLTAVSGALSLLAGGALGEIPAPMQRLLDIAQRNSLNLNNLINDLLDMDKLTLGRMHFDMRVQPLAPLIEQALEANRSYAAPYQVSLQAGRIDAVSVNVDAQRLGQVLANYLSNAAKYSHEQGVVTVEAVIEGESVRVSVIDHGEGVPAAAQPLLFNKFIQADSSDTRRRGGTGLGLAISRELIERMGGRVGFLSTPGQGSTFWFTLPIEAVQVGLPDTQDDRSEPQ